MPNWSDDEGRCWFETDGVPCCQGGTTCPMHRRRKPRKSKAVEEAFKRGAEAMREIAARTIECPDPACCNCVHQRLADEIRALSLPEDKP